MNILHQTIIIEKNRCRTVTKAKNRSILKCLAMKAILCKNYNYNDIILLTSFIRLYRSAVIVFSHDRIKNQIQIRTINHKRTL